MMSYLIEELSMFDRFNEWECIMTAKIVLDVDLMVVIDFNLIGFPYDWSTLVKIKREVCIFFDAKRIVRPLLIVENLTKIKSIKGKNYTFSALLDKGIIELVGTEEEEDCRIAWVSGIL
ncbi:Uncharacterized protein TCM_014598 [Theobroma cacao]|uniref:RNA polymerase Rpb2 domain-containing protein n=1 Tax=Theobroma cacao TaxID=3641 RepID=A0A061FZU5_THECC|nr:Uncharacterized protein TCM_014598 [Theobroma cacao]